jgi:hypothetical protein
VAESWQDLPIGRPIWIDGPSEESLVLASEPLPPDAPAIMVYTGGGPTRPITVVTAILAALDTAALRLFPAWLPEARSIDAPTGAGVAAVRAIALRTAAGGGHFGPFLAQLAERALRGTPMRTTAAAGVPVLEVQAAGLARVIASSYQRAHTALLIRMPAGLGPDQQQALVAGAGWLAEWGGFGIWFAGSPPRGFDGLECVTFWPPGTDVRLEAESDERVPTGVASYPALAGAPHPGSRAEQLLEAALAPCEWAAGRAWNQDHQAHPLTNPVRIDLLWRTERCAVEIDGPEHREPVRFANDRQRDVQLQLAGYAVLRFTNNQVLCHRDLVLTQIHRFLESRRSAFVKGDPHVRAEIVRTRTGDPADSDGRER